jgi:hypothetical protein
MRSAGRRLVKAVSSGDEQASTLAGIFLVKAGERSVALVSEALENGAGSPILATILGDLGGEKAEVELARLAESGEVEVASAAKRALRDLEQIKRMQD